MGLSFASIQDEHGPAIYISGDGTAQTENRLMRLGEEVDKLTSSDTQIVYLDPTRGDGLRVKEFYALTVFPALIIIMDDDTLYQKWEGYMPRPDQVSYAISQAGG